ncbi:PREDICTED: TNF receptor-associated factor 3-like isoform X2 [Branchiostoma belcheri]|uniref:TNF receptor-associated factor 3-like isoform X2 n=1 Tax=Branchiostoma belcheri TaxID=7741 RepID=A0A6P4YNB2_BRABE|nr:PREDICTED: TNF receptor-associated factor 3-like isoform X2 [Branchiostoma belcheri]
MYTKLQYVFPLEDRYKCPICNNVLDAPRQTSCGHRFCDRCLQQAFRKGTAHCPIDQEVLSADEVFRDRCAEKEILQLVVYCPNKEVGCKEQLPRKELESHLQECAYTRVECVHKDQGCDVLSPRHQLAEHLEKECNFRQVSCKYCSETIPLALVQDHLMQCPKATASCPNGCGLTDVTREQVDQHLLEDCPLVEVECSYSGSGCTFKGQRSQLEEHHALSMAEHLSMLTASLARLELSYSESRRELQEVSNQRDLLQSTVRQQATEITSLQQKVDKQDNKIGALQKMVANQTDKLIKFEGDLTSAAKKTDVEEQKRDLAAVKETMKTTENRLTKLETRGSGGGGLFSGAAGEVETQLAAQDRQLGIHDVRLAEMDIRFQILETASFDGTLLWKIKDYTRRKHDAVTGRTLSLYSQPFYTSRNGYKMCARVYLNGDGMGKGTHMSLFFVIMRGDYDALLPWPFRQKVTLMLLDQDQGRRHLSDTFRPDPTSSSFKRPTSDMNIASGCPLFVSQSVAESKTYLNEDTIFIKVIVDCSDLVSP